MGPKSCFLFLFKCHNSERVWFFQAEISSVLWMKLPNRDHLTDRGAGAKFGTSIFKICGRKSDSQEKEGLQCGIYSHKSIACDVNVFPKSSIKNICLFQKMYDDTRLVSHRFCIASLLDFKVHLCLF